MRSSLFATSVLAATLMAVAACRSQGTADPSASAPGPLSGEAPPPDARASSVVVELFTSEGCSSCPPADRLLARLDSAYGGRLIALAYHVDYWDRLGWEDPYALPAFSARQRAYARRLDGRVYTPQMVVNGTEGFVGSRARRAQAAIADARPLDVSAAVRVQAGGKSVEVQAEVREAPEGAVVHLALVQEQAATDVRRGENRGRRLEHVRIVRAIETVSPDSASARFTLPADVSPSDARVVALVQAGAVGPILGSAEAPVVG